MRLRTSSLERLLVVCLALAAGAGCSPGWYRRDADKTALAIIEAGQRDALGKTQPFTIERPSDTLRRRLLMDQHLPYSGPAALGTADLEKIPHWPEKDHPPAVSEATAGAATSDPLHLSMVEALMIAAGNSRDYQSRKEEVFAAALDLDLERNDFRYLFAGSLESKYIDDPGLGPDVRGLENEGGASVARQFKTGAVFAASVAIDLVQLLSGTRESSTGIVVDATVAIPLLRGAGRHIVTEPLTQAERDVVYAILSLERFRRTLAVDVAGQYLSVLQQLDEVRNSEQNYRGLVSETRRARRLADAGRLQAIQVDQARQDELRARDRWIRAQQTYEARLDAMKLMLGLPVDARLELAYEELQEMSRQAREALADAVATTQPDTQPATATGDPAGLGG